jgi:hypothetical protein
MQPSEPYAYLPHFGMFSFVLGFQWLSEFSVCHFSVWKDSRRTPKEGELDHIRDMFWQEGNNNIEEDQILEKQSSVFLIKHLHNHNWAFWQLWARLAFYLDASTEFYYNLYLTAVIDSTYLCLTFRAASETSWTNRKMESTWINDIRDIHDEVKYSNGSRRTRPQGLEMSKMTSITCTTKRSNVPIKRTERLVLPIRNKMIPCSGQSHVNLHW